ncbi:MAG: laminin B domain-containing protein [Aliishimia sp.]
MYAGPNLTAFSAALDTASANVGKVQDAVTSAREGAEDIRWAVGTFGRVEEKADDVAKIIGGLADVLNLLGKVGPIGRAFKPLEQVLKDVENAVESVEAKAKQLDESQIVRDLKSGINDAITRISELEDDVGEKRAEFDERREPVAETIEALDTAGEYIDVSSLSSAVDTISGPPLAATDAVNNLFGAESDPDSVAGKLKAFNDAVDGNPLREAQQMEAALCDIIDQLGFLSKPFDILDSALSPIRWALDASDFIFDTVVSPVLDPILDAIGVNNVFNAIRSELSKLLPDVDILNAFDTNGILPDLDTQLLPSVDLGEFLGLTDLLDQASISVDPLNFTGAELEVGTDGNDILGSLSSVVQQVLSGGAGVDKLLGGLEIDIFKGGAGDDEIDGGEDESSGDMVIFSGSISEYLIEFAEDTVEVLDGAGNVIDVIGDIIISHVDPAAGLIGDGIDIIRNIETFAFDGLEINAFDLRNGLEVLDNGQTGSVDGRPGDQRDFLVATSAGNVGTSLGVTLNGKGGNDHLIGTAFADNLFGGAGDDVLDGGPNGQGISDILDGGIGIDEVTFASSIRETGEQLDLGSVDRGSSILLSSVSAINIERVEGSDFDDILFGREIQNLDQDPANGTYTERLAGGAGSDLLRGFGGDDRLEGNEGSDILIGDSGANQLLGGLGDDVMILDATAIGQQIDGGDGFDTLIYGGLPTVVSTFNDSDDGWTAPSGSLTRQSSGSQAGEGEHLNHVDNALGVTDFFQAPEKFLGDQSEMFGGRISFDLEADAASIYSLGVVLTGGASGNVRLEGDIAIDVALGWQSFDLALDQSGSWRIPGTTLGAGDLASNEVIADVLSNLTSVELLADRVNGVETTRLDNFVMSALPVQAPILTQFSFSSIEGWTSASKPINADFSLMTPADFHEVHLNEGNAGVWIESIDGDNGVTWFVAPDTFHGDQSDKFGGRLEYAIRQVDGTQFNSFSDRDDVAISGAGMTITRNMANPVSSGIWERKVGLLTPDEWVIQGTFDNPTETEFKAILSDVTGVFIRGEHRNGADTVGIDEIRFAPARDGLAGKALEFMAATLDEYPVAELTGRIDVDVAAGTADRFDASGALIAQDTFSGVEQFIGGEQADNFVAELADADGEVSLHGKGGDDRFVIGTGRQIVEGGDGDDVVTLSARGFEQGERYDGGAGSDTLDLAGVAETKWRLDFSGDLRGVDRTQSEADLLASTAATVRNFDRILTGDFDDVISGEFSFVDSGAGNDHVQMGTTFAQQAFLGDGDDRFDSFTIFGGTIDLGLGNDLAISAGGLNGAVMTIIGGPAVALDNEGEPLADDDIFLVGSGRNHLIGGDGQDVVSFGSSLVYSQAPIVLDLSDSAVNSGGASNLTFDGVENVSGGGGNDTIRGDGGANLLIGGDGDDFVEGEGIGTPFATGEGDVLYGNAGNDRLRGLAGDDLLHGGTGDNTLEGGDGNDTVSFAFTEVDQIGTEGVVQTYNSGLFAQVTADLGISGGGSATRVAVLHQDDFEGGVTEFHEFSFPSNPQTTLPGFGTLVGPFRRISAPELTKTFDLGADVDLTQAITVSFDFIEIDGFDGDEITIVFPGGSVGIAFSNGVPQAMSGNGTTNGSIPTPTWTVETDTNLTGDIGGGAADDFVHRISVSFVPMGQFVPIGFGIVQRGGGTDFLRFDNLKITGETNTDTLSDIENLVGGALNDDFTGNGAANALNGGGGDDILRGLGGNDVLLDGAGADTVEGGAGDDTVLAGNGSDTGEGDVYIGGDGLDTLDYSGFDGSVDFLFGDFAHTSYDVEIAEWATGSPTGLRSFNGQTFTPRDVAQALDLSLADSADDALRVIPDTPDDPDLFSITMRTETVSAEDVYSGFEIIIGNDQDNQMRAQEGVIRLEGGLGDDFYFLDRASTEIVEDEDAGFDTVLVDFDYVLPEHFEELQTFTDRGWQLTGNTSDNTIRGGSEVDILDGGFGNDMLFANEGDDTLIGGLGNDTLDGGSGSDTVSYADAGGRVAVFLNKAPEDVGSGQGIDTFISIENVIGTDFDDRIVGDAADNILSGGLGNDVIIGNAGDDTINGDRGDDVLTGSGGDDMIFGGAGADTLNGLGGADTLNGEGGDDTINGGTGVDNVSGGGGKDDIFGLFGADFLFGGTNDDNIRAGGSGDIVHGGNGNDRLVGANGQDVLWGGTDNDVMYGGAGTGGGDGRRDEFVFKSLANGGGGFDIIKDFENNIDKLDLTESGYTNFADLLADTVQIGANLQIDFDFSGIALIENFTLAEFNSGDVIF